MNSVKASPSSLPRINPQRLRKPSPLPLRPLRPDKFRPPRGQKQIFLPNFTLTFLRIPRQSPHHASFLTPLWMNKLDLKDYLYNLYGVHVLSVRSYVIQSRVGFSMPNQRGVKNPGFFRSQAQKKMTVELAQEGPGQGPFVWPDAPEDLEPWGTKQYEEAREKQDKWEERERNRGMNWPEDMKSLSEQARELLRGDVKWRGGELIGGTGEEKK